MLAVRGCFVLLLLVLAPLSWPSSAQTQTAGFTSHQPVLGGSCRICPWGALADIAKEAVSSYGWAIQVCYNCAGGDKEVRLVEAKAEPPAYNPGRLAALGVPASEFAYISPPPPKGPIDFGITSTNFLWWGYQGTHEFAGEPPYRDLRVIATIPSPIYLIAAATAESGITDLSQMRGKAVRVLWSNDVLNDSAPEILAYYGLSRQSIIAAGGSVELGLPVQNRHDFDVIIYEGDLSQAPEFNIWYQLSQQFNLTYFRLPEALLTQLSAHYDMIPLTMPAGFLRGVWEPISTVGYEGNVIYGRADMPEQFAYDLAKAIDERKDLLATAYEHFSYDPKQVWRAYRVPLALGAERYYREKGYLTDADAR